MGGLFSSGSRAQAARAGDEPGVTSDDRALLDLKAQRDQLVGHRKRMEKLVARDEEAAQALVRAGRKDAAMLALRKRRQHQQLALECEAHVGRVDGLIDSIAMARLQKDTVDALTAGAATIRRLQQEIGGVDRVQRLMDEHADAAEAQQEISAALAGAGVPEDDPEVLAELEKLERAHALEAATAAPAASPVGSPVASPAASPAARPAASVAASDAAAPIPAQRTPVLA